MSYLFDSMDIQIPQRSSAIPATAVIPRGGEGERFPLVAYAHGFAGSRHENGGATLLAETLAGEGIASIRMDFAGCGESRESAVEGTILKMLEDLSVSIEYAIQHYPIDPQRLGLIGNSLGGRIACEYINEGKRPVKAAFLTAPAPRNTLVYGLIGGEEAYAAALQEAQEKGFYRLVTIFGATMDLAPQWFTEMLHRNVYAQPSAFTGKMQVIYAADDDVILPEVPAECARHYGGELVELSGGGHTFGFYSGQPEIMAQLAQKARAFFTANL